MGQLSSKLYKHLWVSIYVCKASRNEEMAQNLKKKNQEGSQDLSMEEEKHRKK